MSKVGNKRKHAEKMKTRRSDKAAKAAKYSALAGTSKKSKRSKSKQRISSNTKHAHVMSNCGNPGCGRCYPQFKIMIRKKKKVA